VSLCLCGEKKNLLKHQDTKTPRNLPDLQLEGVGFAGEFLHDYRLSYQLSVIKLNWPLVTVN
jgi:hypothetical protein